MRLLDWLTGRAPGRDDSPPDFPAGLGPATPFSADEDDDDAVLIDEEDIFEISLHIAEQPSRRRSPPKEPPSEPLEPIYTIIDYRDSKGTRTRRRITMIGLADHGPAPCLQAICHERRAFRSFRLDRIESFIDPSSGEVTGAYEFFRDVMELDVRQPPQTARSERVQPSLTAKTAREKLRPMVAILLAAGYSDGQLHREELDQVIRYVEDELHDLVASGSFTGDVTLDLIDEVAALVRKMRPPKEAIASYFFRVLALNGARAQRFDTALEAVIAADGRIMPDEVGFLEEIAEARRAAR